MTPFRRLAAPSLAASTIDGLARSKAVATALSTAAGTEAATALSTAAGTEAATALSTAAGTARVTALSTAASTSLTFTPPLLIEVLPFHTAHPARLSIVASVLQRGGGIHCPTKECIRSAYPWPITS